MAKKHRKERRTPAQRLNICEPAKNARRLAPAERVNHPAHYNAGKIEVIEAIEDWKLGFHDGNVVKYVARAPHKGNQLEDLKKARWYLDRAIENLTKSLGDTA